ncbi:MAG: hypothetical protein RL077_1275 [Verrucomicrobiota bacterium]
MRVRKLTLRHFRNVGFAALEFSGRQQFLVGANGQGKTNLLEALGFLTALRSFRTTDTAVLVGLGHPVAALAFGVEHERQGETAVTIKIRREGKELWCDQERVTKLSDYLGKFPTVVFSAQDIQLVRGAPAIRRRWLDLTMAAMDAGYLRVLQTATRALAERNALLKLGRGSPAELSAFEAALAPAAAELIARRADGLKALGQSLMTTYARLSGNDEPASLVYEPNFPEPNAEALLAKMEASRARDQQLRSTQTGPHRDDFRFNVKGSSAKDFASEGQQRSVVLALRLAQAAWFREKSGICPVLLADDVLGELDPARRTRFWGALDPDSQIIATGTHFDGAEMLGGGVVGRDRWQVFQVSDGGFTEGPSV